MNWLFNSGAWTTLVDANLWQQTLALSTPLALAAIGGVISERSGVVNIAMEGMMLTGAFFAVSFDVVYQNIHVTIPVLRDIISPDHAALAGLLAAVAAGGIMATVHAFAAIRLKADQIVSGMAINLLALGLTGYLYSTIYGATNPPSPCEPPTPCKHGDVFSIPDWNLLHFDSLPVVGWPISGIHRILFEQNPMVYLMILLVMLTHLFLFRTTLGLRIRAVGEHPRAADTAGINVQRLRYLAVILSGMLSGLAGAYLSLGDTPGFNDNMTSGKGFIALAAMIFGKWTPFGAFGACLLFGFGYALFSALQTTPGPLQSYSTLLGALPYLLAIVAVAGFVGRATPPAADGQPYDPAEAA